MPRTAAVPRPSVLFIRLGGLAALTSLTLGGAIACSGGTDGTKAVEIVPVGESLPPTVVEQPITTETAGFVVPEDLTYTMAESAFTAKRYSEATEMFSVLASEQPDAAWNHYMLGLAAWKAGQPDRAERAFTAAIERDPKHVKSELNLTRVLLDMRRPEEALTHVQQALVLDSVSAEGWRLLGRVRGQLNEVEPALTAYRKAVALDDKDVWSMNNMGLVLIEAGRFEEALGPLARATELAPTAPVYQNNLGMALERTGHYTAAAEAYRTALTNDSTYKRASVSLARVEQLTESPTLVAVDLKGLSSTFAIEISMIGQGTVVMVPPPNER